jgi:hypothetical protein
MNSLASLMLCNCHFFNASVLYAQAFSLNPRVPSGKRLHNYGKSPFLMGKSAINGHVQ